MASSDNVSRRLSRTESELKKRAFHEYARSTFDDRNDRRPDLPHPHLSVVRGEESRISKIRERFKDKPQKAILLENVAKSRTELIRHLSTRTKKRSPIYEQTEEGNDGQAKETKALVDKIKVLANQLKEPVDEIKELLDKVEESTDSTTASADNAKELLIKIKTLAHKATQPADKAKELVDTVEELGDKIKEPLDEFKVGIMYFKKDDDRQWRGEQYGDIDSSSGEFPNQKVKIDTILSNTAKNRKLFKRDEGSIKYFHFPANHMEWIETAITRYYEVNGNTQQDFEEYENQLLSFEHWRGQLHGAGIGKDLFHQRHMRPRCAHISDSRDPNAPSHISLFLPYLHWETNRRRSKMVQIVHELVEDNKVSLNSHFLAAARTEAHCLHSKFDRGDIKNKIAKYLYDIAQVWDAMDYDADERLLRQSFSETTQDVVTAGPRGAKWEPPLHIRQTLDRSYFSIVESTATRDTDQVIYRQTRAKTKKERRENDQENEKAATSSTSLNTTPQHIESRAVSRTIITGPGSTTSSSIATKKKKMMTKLVGVTRVVMVDQLWMWILGEDTIITSFPRRWGRNKPDSSDVHKSLRQMLGKRKRIRSIYHLATLIIDQCSKVFFDRTQPMDDRPEVMDMFAHAIGNLANNATMAHQMFWDNVRLSTKRTFTSDRDPLRYLNIDQEGVLLKESQDIAEELSIMERIFGKQLALVSELGKQMRIRYDKSKNLPGKLLDDISHIDLDVDEAALLVQKIENRIMEIEEFRKPLTKTIEQLQGLLSLKQHQFSILEARSSIEQARFNTYQGRIILVFTAVTIIFSPLGFFTGFFGMNNKTSTGNGWMTIYEQIMYMFAISGGIITVALFLAFRWMSFRPNRRVIKKKLFSRRSPDEPIPLSEVIEEYHKDVQEIKRKNNKKRGHRTTGRSSNVTGWLNNGAGGSRWRRNQSAISEV